MSFDPGAFAARVDSVDGFQSPNKFRVRILPRTMEADRVLEFLCFATDIPQVGFATSAVKPLGYGTLTRNAALGPSYGGGAVNLNFYDDNAKTVYTFFRKWQQKVSDSEYAPGDGPAGPFKLGYLDDYAARVSITTFSQDGATNNRVLLHDAWPFSVGPSRLDWTSRDQVGVLPVTLMFTSVTHSLLELE